MGATQLLDENANVYPIATPASDLGWVRYTKSDRVEQWCSIAEIACGAVFTECRGSMNVSDCPDFEARPAIGDRCRRCQAIRAWRRLVEAGLDELCREAP